MYAGPIPPARRTTYRRVTYETGGPPTMGRAGHLQWKVRSTHLGFTLGKGRALSLGFHRRRFT